jgi:hypothetical protein
MGVALPGCLLPTPIVSELLHHYPSVSFDRGQNSMLDNAGLTDLPAKKAKREAVAHLHSSVRQVDG